MHIGLNGTEHAHELSVDKLCILEKIRSVAAKKLGFVVNVEDATQKTPASPKLILISPAASYYKPDGGLVSKDSIHFTARAMSMQNMHKTFPVTGGLCTAAAARLTGTLVNECCNTPDTPEITIGHPSGTMVFTIKFSEEGENVIFGKVAVARDRKSVV